jgi:hypothetical protein
MRVYQMEYHVRPTAQGNHQSMKSAPVDGVDMLLPRGMFLNQQNWMQPKGSLLAEDSGDFSSRHLPSQSGH